MEWTLVLVSVKILQFYWHKWRCLFPTNNHKKNLAGIFEYTENVLCDFIAAWQLKHKKTDKDTLKSVPVMTLKELLDPSKKWEREDHCTEKHVQNIRRTLAVLTTKTTKIVYHKITTVTYQGNLIYSAIIN